MGFLEGMGEMLPSPSFYDDSTFCHYSRFLVTAQVAPILSQDKARGAQNRSVYKIREGARREERQVCARRRLVSTTATQSWGKRGVT